MNKFMRKLQAGFTLIELLIGLVVGIILLGGLVQIFILTKNNYRIQQGLNYMQENLRFAGGEVGYAARMGGFFYTVGQPSEAAAANTAAVFGTTSGAGSGLVQRASELTLLPGMAVTPDCGVLAWTVGVQGFNGGAVAPACVSGANYVTGTDALFVTYLRPVFLGLPQITTPPSATGVGALTQAETITNVVATDIYAIIFDPESKPDIYTKQGGLIGTGSSLGPYIVPSLQYNATETSLIEANFGVLVKRGAAMMPVQAELFYVRACAVLDGAVCAAGSDGGNPQPTLIRRNLLNDTEEAIVSGIEQFQLEYLASGCAGYLSAAGIEAWTGCDGAFTNVQRWQRVINVRVALLARSNERSNEIDGETYALSADTPAYSPATNIAQLPLNTRYRRRTLVSFAQPRNSVRPLPPSVP